MPTTLQELTEHGQSAWIDFLSRRFVDDGELAGLVGQGLSGVTSNPTIFQGAIAGSEDYSEQLRTVLRTESDAKEVFFALAQRDIQAACDLLRPVFDREEGSADGWVSLEVDPRLADDTDATIAEATRLRDMVARPNLFVKIPGTEAGLPAIEECIARGIPINVTLLFSLDRHRAAARAYMRGLRRRRDAGKDLRGLASVASYFVSRVDTEADRRLDALDVPAEVKGDLKGTLAIANAKLAYQSYKELFSGPEWDELAAVGGTPQRCLWASTSVKDPAYRDVTYVEELIGPQTVSTMPPDTIAAFLDHGHVADTLESDLEAAHRTFERFAAAGVDYDDVTATLEREGVDKFATSFRQLLDGVREKRDQLASA